MTVMATHTNIRVHLKDGRLHEVQSGEVRIDGGAISVREDNLVAVFPHGGWTEANYEKAPGAAF